MKVRDHTINAKEYKGRWTDASDRYCPCRSCYDVHDCGYCNSRGDRIVSMECVTRYNRGCPDIKPEPKHILSKYGTICKRCGVKVR